jgi:hypothetical protein
MPEIVPVKVGNLGLANTFLKPSLPIAASALVGTFGDISGVIAAFSEGLESSFCHGIDRHVACGPVFALGDRDNPCSEIHILPAQLPLFIPAHPGVKCQIEFRFSLGISRPDLRP